MAHNESEIRDNDGRLIAVRTVEENSDGSHRVRTQDAHIGLFGNIERGDFSDDRVVYDDGSEYEPGGQRLH